MTDGLNPMTAARRPTRAELPRRLYKAATFAPEGEGFAILLDGTVAKTPAKHPLIVAAEPVAAVMAAEWQAQGEHIDPATMPMTRLVNAAIDRVADEMPAVRADIVKYAGSDLLCYRADGPEALVERQDEVWGPLIAWAREALGARFILAEGIVHAAQDDRTLAAIARALEPYDALSLAALHTATTLTGSAIIALALAHGRLTAEEAWATAHVDEDFQMSHWGADETALARRAARWQEMAAAALVLSALR